MKSALILLAALTLMAAPAQACVLFKGAVPRVGSESAGPVGEVVLHFSGDVQADQSTITVVQELTGQTVSHGAPYLKDATHIAVLADANEPGRYKVSWSVMCDCGTPNPGDYSFTVK